MSQETLFVFAAQGGGTRLGWREREGPNVRAERLAKRYLHEVERGGAVFDLLDDDDGRAYLTIGVARRHYDGHRRDDRLLGLLIPWEQARAYFPLDYAELLAQWTAATEGLADEPFDGAAGSRRFIDLAAGDWARRDRWRLPGRSPLSAREAVAAFARLCRAEPSRATADEFDWSGFSRTLSLFPPAAQRLLHVVVTDAEFVPKDVRIAVQCRRDPLAALRTRERPDVEPPASSRSSSSYVEFLTQVVAASPASADWSDLWDDIRRRTREVLSDDPDSLWDRGVAFEILELVGQVGLGELRRQSVLERARIARTFAARHPKVGLAARLKLLVDMPTARSLVERMVRRQPPNWNELTDVASLDPTVATTVALFQGVGLERLGPDQVRTWRAELGDGGLQNLAEAAFETLLPDALNDSTAQVWLDLLTSPAILDRLDAERRLRLFDYFRRFAGSSVVIERPLARLLTACGAGRESVDQRFGRHERVSAAGAGLSARASLDDRFQLLEAAGSLDDPALPLLLASSDWQGGSLTRGLSERLSAAEGWPAWTLWCLRRAGGLAELCAATRRRGRRPGGAVRDYLAALDETFGAPHGSRLAGIVRWARGAAPIAAVARRRLARLSADPAAFAPDGPLSETRQALLDWPSGLLDDSVRLARLYALQVAPRSADDGERLVAWFERLAPDVWSEWLQTARDAAELFLSADERTPAGLVGAAAIETLRLGAFSRSS